MRASAPKIRKLQFVIMCTSTAIVTAVYILSTAILAHGFVEGHEPKPVYFTLIYSGGENGYNSSGGIPSVNIALEAIECHQLLPGYNLTYRTARNSKVIPKENACYITCIHCDKFLNTRVCSYCTNIPVHTY